MSEIQMPEVAIEPTLNLFPEVTWDRWAGDGIEHASAFGWIEREDGKSDFVVILIDRDGPWLISTSSARYSSEFSQRLGFQGHSSCKRIEDYFPDVKSVRLKAMEVAASVPTGRFCTADDHRRYASRGICGKCGKDLTGRAG